MYIQYIPLGTAGVSLETTASGNRVVCVAVSFSKFLSCNCVSLSMILEEVYDVLVLQYLHQLVVSRLHMYKHFFDGVRTCTCTSTY